MKPILQNIAIPIIDTLAKKVVVAEKPVNDTLEVLSKVNEFYNTAWDKLIFIILGAFTILGVFVPFVIQHFQNKSLKASEKELESKFNLKVVELKQAIEEDLNLKFEQKIHDFKKELEDKVEKIKEGANASAFHVQAQYHYDKEFFRLATRDFINSAISYSTIGDHVNTKATLTGIFNCLGKLNKEDIVHLENIEGLKIIEIMDDIDYNNNGGTFTREIRDIKSKLYKTLNAVEKENDNNK